MLPRLLCVALLSLIRPTSQAPFTRGNIIVLEVQAITGTTANTAVSLVELKNGSSSLTTAVQTISIPTSVVQVPANAYSSVMQLSASSSACSRGVAFSRVLPILFPRVKCSTSDVCRLSIGRRICRCFS